ncbi:MAG TPA: nucleotidyltransferase domain-containing protein [Desulfotomaculum sp.]|nr:nucleotidyltransferase domain-containing protein [Desulfotomaculum sp.]
MDPRELSILSGKGWKTLGKESSPVVTEELLSEVVQRILSVTKKPKLIALFGSRARGNSRPDSDLDILIVMDSDLPRWKRPAPIRRALTGLFPTKDIVVYTPEEIEEWKAVPNAFITTILREGKILYEG